MSIGKILMALGFFLMVLGVFFVLKDTVPWVGKLPGDIHIRKENFTFYFPITSCILVSIVVTIIIKLFFRR